jgi:hypothetical protein
MRPQTWTCDVCGQVAPVTTTRGSIRVRCDACQKEKGRADRRAYAISQRRQRRVAVGQTTYLGQNAAGGAGGPARVENQLVDLRLRVEAAKPLLRLALTHASWRLVAAALAEIEGKDVPTIDLRAEIAQMSA